MTLRRFLDAGYALFVEAWQQVGRKEGVHLLEAIDRVNEEIGLERETPVAAAASAGPTSADNDRALAELNAMMAGVSKR